MGCVGAIRLGIQVVSRHRIGPRPAPTTYGFVFTHPAFAFCRESGLADHIKTDFLDQLQNDAVEVFTDPLASPTGFPFKVVKMDGIDDCEIYDERPRICDLGYLRKAYLKPDGGRAKFMMGYGAGVQPLLRKVGARTLFTGSARLCVVGNAEWDMVVLMEFPSKEAWVKMFEMLESPEHHAIHQSRNDALEGQILYAATQVGGTTQ